MMNTNFIKINNKTSLIKENTYGNTSIDQIQFSTRYFWTLCQYVKNSTTQSKINTKPKHAQTTDNMQLQNLTDTRGYQPESMRNENPLPYFYNNMSLIQINS